MLLRSEDALRQTERVSKELLVLSNLFRYKNGKVWPFLDGINVFTARVQVLMETVTVPPRGFRDQLPNI